MSLLGCTANLQKLMNTFLRGIKNVIDFIDGIIINTTTHKEYLIVMEQVYFSIIAKILYKNPSIGNGFGNQEVCYLGYMLTPIGIRPSKKILKAMRDGSSTNQHQSGSIPLRPVPLIQGSH
jgi:hypothetical protein